MPDARALVSSARLSQFLAEPGTAALPLHLVTAEAYEAWRAAQPERVSDWLTAIGFRPARGRVGLVPDGAGGVALAVAGLGTARERARTRFAAAAARAALPAGVWRIESGLETAEAACEAALGWLLDSYRFERYRRRRDEGTDGAEAAPRLVLPEGVDAARLAAMANGEALTRELINTPASDMGPDELEAALVALAEEMGAGIEVIRGEELIAANLPLIHAVGRASPRAPRLIDLRWGRRGPRLTLVGKGVCFDTGGLNLKPGSSMALMKKDMGGAATVAGLARMIAALDLPLRLRVLVPAVENAVSGASFRPGDILVSRKGLTVEINNTDAEGRLVLADALALADEEAPELMISMATLTGAARVAVGPDLAPFYATDEALAAAIARGGAALADPVWRLPFWDPYEAMIEPGTADLDNAPRGGFAGSITAALFLRRFVEAAGAYAHFDIYGWQPEAAPGRPKGGVGQGARAVLAALPEVLGL